MAKGKSSSSKGYVSKGGKEGRPSRKLLNSIRRDKRNFVVVDMQTIRSMTAKEDFYRELSKRRDQKSKRNIIMWMWGEFWCLIMFLKDRIWMMIN